MRTFVLFIAAAVALALPAFAKETENSPTPDMLATDLIVKTWQPSPETLVELLDMVDTETIVNGREALRRHGLDRVSGDIRWGACSDIFGEICYRTSTVAQRVVRSSLRAMTHDPAFLANMTTAQQGWLVAKVSSMAGEGNMQKLLRDVELLYTKEFDTTQALDYQRWRQNACNFALRPNDGGLGNWRDVNEAMTVEECMQDEFTHFLNDNYCAPATSPDTCDLQNVSWMYGFLQRRYIIGGEDFVQDWQSLLLLTAEHVGVATTAETTAD